MKYNIVCVSIDYSTSIIGTYLTFKDAIEARTLLINKKFKNDEEHTNYRIYYEKDNITSVFYIGYFGKTLLAKYFVIEFEDLSEEYDD